MVDRVEECAVGYDLVGVRGGEIASAVTAAAVRIQAVLALVMGLLPFRSWVNLTSVRNL
jgi:hypothetical protein